MIEFNAKVCNLKGEAVPSVPLSKDYVQIFYTEVGGEKIENIVNIGLIARVIHYQNAKAREVISSTKTRNEINCSKKKFRKQKGGGVARHGSKNAPQFRGGAKAFGPSLYRDFEYSLNKQIRKAALCSALRIHFQRGTLFIIEDNDFLQPRTQEILKFLSIFPVYPAIINGQDENGNIPFIPMASVRSFRNNRKVPKSLFVGESKENQKNTLLGVKNLNSLGVNFIPAIGLNVKDVMNSTYLFIFRSALDNITKKCITKKEQKNV